MRLKNAPGFITICQMMSDKFEQNDKVCGMIYFTSDLQKKIFPLFHYSLKAGGILFLGLFVIIFNSTLKYSIKV